MAKTYAQMQAQIATLQKQAESIRQKEVAGVVARIKEAIAHYGLTADDLGLDGKVRAPRRAAAGKSAVRKAGKAPRGTVKFRDEQGNVWSGRGPRPAWFKAALASGKKPDELLA